MPALYVIRHAEATDRGKLLGRSDPPISEEGVRQAQRMASLLPACAAVYSSPLRRALQTACFLRNIPIVLSSLAEISYGEWDGLTWAEIEQKWPDLAARKLKRWQDVTSPGGEPWPDFHDRVRRTLDSILAGPLPAAIVAHEAVNAVIVHELTGTAIQSYQQHHCEIGKHDLRFGR